MIYEFLTSKGILTDEHKKSLVVDRGFTEEVIADHRFFSGGKYLLEFHKEFVEKFSEEELITSGCFIKPERSQEVVFSSQLLDGRIIIPYLDRENRAYFVRPHKMGLEVPIQIYHNKCMNDPSTSAILTESEFKAVAGTVFGFKTIGIPGISSFSDMHFKRLIEFINKAGIKNVCILYDNEVKDNPNYTNYKEDTFKRHDTEYFAYLMAKNLLREGIDARIGRLPDSWRINGKVDLDGALAQKRTKDDLKHVITESKNPKAYIQDLSQEIQNVLNRKLAKKHYRSNVSTDWGKYVATRRQGKQEWPETISNFTLKILARHETPEGIIREIVLVDEFGKFSRSFSLPAESMIAKDGFASFVMNKGNYVWTGSGDDLANIWRGLFLEDDGRHIIEPDHVGWVGDEKMFMFGNLAIRHNGEEIHPDKHSIFWREKHGLKPVPISISSGKSAISEGIPLISTTEIDLKDVRAKMVDTVGKYEAYIIFGWIASVLFMEDVFQAYNCFPFMFMAGRRGSGKSTVAEWAMNCFGIETGGKMASDTTPVAIQRYLSYYSSLPVFIDEYRNSKMITYKNGFLRNVYNRQSAGKGVKANFGVREGKIRGTLLVAGEETPDDNALLTRCVVINVKERNRVNNHFNWFQNHRSSLSYFTYNILKRKHELLEEYMTNLHGGKAFFIKNGLDDRMAINYAIIGAGYCAAFGELPDDFQNYLANESVRVKQEYDQERAVTVFFEDLLAMQSDGKHLKGRMWTEDETCIYLYFGALYNVWASQHRMVHGTEPFKAAALRKYLEEEPGFLEFDHLKKIDGRPRRCVVFDKLKAPREVIELVQEKESGPS